MTVSARSLAGAAMAAGVVGSVLLGLSPAAATRCVTSDLDEDARRADAVFVASVIEDRGDFRYLVRASDIYKGSPGAFVTVDTGDPGFTGTVDLRPDRQYVLFVDRSDQPGVWEIPVCSGTSEISSRVLSQLDRVLGPATPLRGPAAEGDDPSATATADAEATGTEPAAEATTAEDADGSRTWLWVGAGAVLLAAAGGVAAATRLRRLH